MTDKEKEIVRALRCCAEGECKDCAMHEDKQRCQENLLDKAAEAIERLTAENAALREKVPQWISVEDRLPEAWKDEDGVLVNYMIYTPEFGADIGNYHAMAKRWLCMAIPCTVTHWMPLPGAPEEGEKHE
jgi:hypothetical protein